LLQTAVKLLNQPAAGSKESKEEQLSTCPRKRRTRRRRSHLLAGAALPNHEKRTRSAVDYTPTLDKEKTKNPAKEIRILLGTRHHNWREGFARSTINKVLAPGQDAGYRLFATARIESNSIGTYERAPVDYEAVTNQYRFQYLMTCPITRRATNPADFNACYDRLACDPLDKVLYNAIC
jgi:hypothetical protein